MVQKDIKFYVLVGLGFTISLVGLLSPPIGIVDNSVLVVTGLFLSVAGGLIGAVIHLDFKNLYFHIGPMPTKIKEDKKKCVKDEEDSK